jgi:hypothetical protein
MMWGLHIDLWPYLQQSRPCWHRQHLGGLHRRPLATAKVLAVGWQHMCSKNFLHCQPQASVDVIFSLGGLAVQSLK